MASVIGAPPPAGPDKMECKAPALLDVWFVNELGRFRKALHTLVFRHLESEVVLMV